MTERNGQEGREFESKLIPIMREGVEIVKLIVFKELRDSLVSREAGLPPAEAAKLAGAIINELFGTPNPQPELAAFVEENRGRIEEELRGLAGRLAKLRIPLTDGLRVQFLCDSLEGQPSEATLARARELGVLMVDREVPLPRNFLDLVRRLGAAYGLLVPTEQRTAG
ncbi:MAG: hypothetical protein M0017_12480 [Desulfobacteraceae bacterium]|nr:hypothetical protein [Desulfobacteraceae bacterium]